MNSINKHVLACVLAFLATGIATGYAEPDEHGHEAHEESAADEHGHDEEAGDEEEGHGHGGHKEEASSDAELSAEQMSAAEIKVVELQPHIVDYEVYAPGEVLSNGYASDRVSARIPSIVLQRHITLGETAKAGQPLVTLFSEELVEAQAAYKIAVSEWQRVEAMGRQAVGDKRYVTAQGDMAALAGKLEAYGLSANDIADLTRNAKPKLGEYVLRAERDGVVLKDDFHQGQRVDAGQTIIDVVDEHELWVEARLPPGLAQNIPINTPATVKVHGEVFDAKVIQAAHKIDPRTRTRVIRLSTNNDDHRLHPGVFADVLFHFQTETPVLALPEAAVLRAADGDWQVFVEAAPGRFEPKEVDIVNTFGKKIVISGIEPGSRVVSEGAFFVQSEIAKSGFEVHNH